MQLFYTPDIEADQKLYTLNEVESKHCIRVLRKKIEDTIQLIDGNGGWYVAKIVDPNQKHCTVQIISADHELGKKPMNIHIGIAPTKNIDRTEWFLEKSTELYIGEVTPLLCDHSERKVIKHERLNKVITSAMKQSLKAYHPILHELTPIQKFIEQTFDGQKFIAHCEEDGEKIHLKDAITKGENVLILIGPEGDFSPKEIKLALDNGFKPISLGESRLRTETAGVAACHIANLMNE